MTGDQKIRAGVVGAGHMGQYHILAFMELWDVELVGIADAVGVAVGVNVGVAGMPGHPAVVVRSSAKFFSEPVKPPETLSTVRVQVPAADLPRSAASGMAGR